MSQVVGNTALAYARVWHHVDASERVLGKLAERIAIVLMGKHKPIFDPSADCGDYVVITNARKVKVTGSKAEQVLYRHHTMFPGGLKEIPYKTMMQRKPDEIIRQAVSGMLPKNKLRERRLQRLRIFEDDDMGVFQHNILKRWEDGTLTQSVPLAKAPSSQA
ncbi:60S ribosomal protein L23 [Daedalea quercina L-15889]|uniref:60S ribosomal protein L23 n=1 Tax=Daedalea quercina L-15889 TaxID=1314783 RepID=A0A165R497_9APHY|nr:60S ribosomal protein L23 [Daedalea quercina L-15889]